MDLKGVVIDNELINKVLPSLPNLKKFFLTANNAKVTLAAAGNVESPGLARLAEQVLQSLRILLGGSPDLQELYLTLPSIEDEAPWQSFIKDFADKHQKLKRLKIQTGNSLSAALITTLFKSFPEASIDVNLDKLDFN